jgi:hypothetical protein
MKKIFIYSLGIFLLAFFVCLPLILPYFKSGFFPTHDGEWAVVRLSDMYREIKDLQFPARYSGYLNFEYGYPLFNFAYPLPYYLGLIFVFLKLGFVNSIKILFSLSVIFSFFSMFILSKDLWKSKWAALLSSILYVYVPYRIIDLYVRGSIGESLSFILFPLILFGIKKIYNKKRVLDIAVVGVLYALLITTHNIMTILFGIVVAFVLLVGLLKKDISFVVRLLLSLFFSLCLSAFFWIPAIFEKNLILLSKIPIADRSLYFVKPLQLIIPQWGYGVPTGQNPFSYQIGVPQLIIFVLAIIFALKNIKKDKYAKIALFLVAVIVCISFLLFSPSAIVWKVTPLLSEINYPWTLLAIIVFLISLLSGYLAKLGKIFTLIFVVLGTAAIFLFIPYAKPQYTVNRGDTFYLTNQATTTSSNEQMPLWVKELPTKAPMQKVELLSGGPENLSYNSKKISFVVDLPRSEIVRINTIYYPGWVFSIDGIKTGINYSNKFGVININVSAGKHIIKGEFTETPLRLFSDIISLISVVGLMIFLMYSLIHKLKKT